MNNDCKNWNTVMYDNENKPLIKYDPVHNELVNIQTGEVIEWEDLK